MTKEPKLEAAVRIVPEWQDYDQEIKQLQIRFQKEKETGALHEEKTKEPRQEGRKNLVFGQMLLCSSHFCLLQKQQNHK